LYLNPYVGIVVKGSSSNSTPNDAGCEVMPHLYEDKIQHINQQQFHQRLQFSLTTPVIRYKGLHRRSPNGIVSLAAFLDTLKMNMHLKHATNPHLHPVAFIFN